MKMSTYIIAGALFLSTTGCSHPPPPSFSTKSMSIMDFGNGHVVIRNDGVAGYIRKYGRSGALCGIRDKRALRDAIESAAPRDGLFEDITVREVFAIRLLEMSEEPWSPERLGEFHRATSAEREETMQEIERDLESGTWKMTISEGEH
jgi:hypothetical protein